MDGRDADRRGRRRAERRAVGDLRHPAERRGTAVPFQFGRVPRPRLQTVGARRQGARLLRKVRTPGEAVRLDSRNRLPERKRNLCRRAAQLAAAEDHNEAGGHQGNGGGSVTELGTGDWELGAGGWGERSTLPPATITQRPATSTQPPATSTQPPATSTQPPAPSHQHPATKSLPVPLPTRSVSADRSRPRF